MLLFFTRLFFVVSGRPHPAHRLAFRPAAIEDGTTGWSIFDRKDRAAPYRNRANLNSIIYN